MKKLLIALTSLVLFAGCANNTAPAATSTPEVTPEATQEAAATPETSPEVNTGLKILAPNGAGDKAAIAARINAIKKQADETESEFDREKLQEKIGRAHV